jgi:hypothetical protein
MEGEMAYAQRRIQIPSWVRPICVLFLVWQALIVLPAVRYAQVLLPITLVRVHYLLVSSLILRKKIYLVLAFGLHLSLGYYP